MKMWASFLDSNNFSIGIHFFKVLVQIHYSRSPGLTICSLALTSRLAFPWVLPEKSPKINKIKPRKSAKKARKWLKIEQNPPFLTKNELFSPFFGLFWRFIPAFQAKFAPKYRGTPKKDKNRKMDLFLAILVVLELFLAICGQPPTKWKKGPQNEIWPNFWWFFCFDFQDGRYTPKMAFFLIEHWKIERTFQDF